MVLCVQGTCILRYDTWVVWVVVVSGEQYYHMPAGSSGSLMFPWSGGHSLLWVFLFVV